MAVCKQTPQAFIQETFSPVVAVICSPSAKGICQKNNLSFVELVEPFCRLSTVEATIRDPSNNVISLHNLKVVLKDMNSQVPSANAAKKFLSEAVSKAFVSSNDAGPTIKVKNAINSLQIVSVTPWFEEYREAYIEMIPPAEHEFTRHFLGCLFIVSSQSPNVLEEFVLLQKEQEKHQNTSSNIMKWFSPEILKYYVLLHDVLDGNLGNAEASYQKMKENFGAMYCHLLQINSQNLDQRSTTNGPDPWSHFLNKTVNKRITEQYKGGSIEELRENVDQIVIQDNVGLVQVADEMTNNENNLSTTIPHPLSASLDGDMFPTEMQLQIPDSNPLSTSNYLKEITKEKLYANVPHGAFLTTSDLERIKTFFQEFCIRALLPFAERQIRFLNDQVANRRGLHRSLISAKKWFAGNKPIPSSSTVIYSHDAPEIKIRKLGDLCFIFQLYDLAYQAFHAAKRDFNADQAWLYFAGALEMAALSVFMVGNSSQRQYPTHYMELAISTYLNTCKLLPFATRAALLSTECLKAKNKYGDAATQFIQLTSEDDLRSALLLEQAAHCFLHQINPMIRKYAFHIVLAGHRFNKAGLRKHGLRSYSQAEYVYKVLGWLLVEDHINFTVGRHALNLSQLEIAYNAFSSLFNEQSRQSTDQQALYLKEYLSVFQQCLKEKVLNNVLPSLPLPYIANKNIKVILGQPYDLSTLMSSGEEIVVTGTQFDCSSQDLAAWNKLEELSIIASQGSLPFNHKPQMQYLSNFTDNSSKPFAVVNERIILELQFKNPLQIPLSLTNVYLLWKFHASSQQNDMLDDISNELAENNLTNSYIESIKLLEYSLDGKETNKLQLSVLPKKTGELRIESVCLTVAPRAGSGDHEGDGKKVVNNFASHCSARGKVALEVQGPRLNNTMLEKNNKTYAQDYRLQINIVNQMPRLQVKFFCFPRRLFSGEICKINAEFTNAGTCALKRLMVASPNPEIFTFGDGASTESSNVYSEMPASPGQREPTSVKKWESVKYMCEVPLPEGRTSVLVPSQGFQVPMWVRVDSTAQDVRLNLLFYYETTEEGAKLRHRILCQTIPITVIPSLRVKTFASRICNPKNEETSGTSSECLHLVLDIENMCEASRSLPLEFSIIQISCASQKWYIRPLSSVQRDMTIKPGCTLNLGLKAHPVVSKDQTSCATVMSDVVFSDTEINSSSTPCKDFCIRSQSTLPNLTNTGVPQQSANLRGAAAIANRKIKESLEACEHVALALIILWKAVVEQDGHRKIVMGQHHVAVNSITTVQASEQKTLSAKQEPSWDPELQESNSPLVDPGTLSQFIKFAIRHSFHVKNNFSVNRLIVIDVNITLHNCTNRKLVCHIQTSSSKLSDIPLSHLPLSPSLQELCKGPTEPGFIWLGHRHIIVQLEGNSSHTTVLKAGFSLPGTYNLSNICIEVESDWSSEKRCVQQELAPSLIVVEDFGN